MPHLPQLKCADSSQPICRSRLALHPPPLPQADRCPQLVWRGLQGVLKPLRLGAQAYLENTDAAFAKDAAGTPERRPLPETTRSLPSLCAARTERQHANVNAPPPPLAPFSSPLYPLPQLPCPA
eukprot:2808676-Pleurochrysis_carterae.AAC.4